MATSEYRPKIRHCEAHGDYQASIRDSEGCERWLPGCPFCAQEMEISKLIGRAAIPARFVDRRLSTYKPKLAGQFEALRVAQEYVNQFDDVEKTGRCLLFCGRPGTGKTHLAVGILNEIMPKRSGLYATVLTAVRRVKETWNRESRRTEREIITDFVKPGLLVLDEVGVQFGSEAERLILFEIINGRYEQMRPTVLMSNLDLKGVEANLGERAVDRLRENGGRIVIFDWDSYRKAA